MEPNSIVAALQTLLAGGGNVGQNGLVPPVVKPAPQPGISSPQVPSILPRNKASGGAGSPMDVRPAAARPNGAPVPAAAPANGKPPSIMDRVGRYGNAASAGMGAVSPDASPLQAFGEALFGAIKGRRDVKAAEDTLAYERAYKEDERNYQRGRDTKADARAAAAEGRAAAEVEYRHGRDLIEDQRNAAKDAREARRDEFSNLKTAAEIEAERNGKPLTDYQIEDIVAKNNNLFTDADRSAERTRLRAIGRGPSIKDDSRAPGAGADGVGTNKGDRGGPSILPQATPGLTDVPKSPPNPAAQPIASQGGVGGSGTAKDPYKPQSMNDLSGLRPGAIYVNPADGKLYRYKGTPATQ